MSIMQGGKPKKVSTPSKEASVKKEASNTIKSGEDKKKTRRVKKG